MAERLLDFSQPLDVALLDQVVTIMFTPTTPQGERDQAQRLLTQFQEHSESWTRVDKILETSQNPNTKFLALRVLELLIQYRWKALPREQCDGIKNYIASLIIKMSSDAGVMQRERMYLNKLNMSLVQIIKQEWPHQWQSFVPEIIGSSRSNESLCENNMQILKLLSEEVFDFSAGQMTSSKTSELKTSFTKEFAQIFELCHVILTNSTNPSLLTATLNTLLKFLNWIPVGFIFETQIIDVLVHKLFPEPAFRTLSTQCLAEIAALVVPEYDEHFRKLYTSVMSRLRTFFPLNTDLSQLFAQAHLQREQEFVQHLALFLTAFFRNHRAAVERSDTAQDNLDGHEFLCKLSAVEDEEVFKICLEYWVTLAAELYHEAPHLSSASLPVTTLGMEMGNTAAGASAASTPRRTFYAPCLSKARRVIILRFAKPEEVLLTEDENGEVVRELVKDSEVTALYKQMRETLVYLTHLDYTDTQDIMLSHLHAQVEGSTWSRAELNSLSWAIGSISGAVQEDLEKRFVVTVIRDLLSLVELKRGKDNKAAIAGCIMYVVGQYPRFLRAHWKFLKTVVNKLFEFMHEKHPGVQDMAVDTFLKIAIKCKRKFVITNAGEARPFVDDILDNIPQISCDLEPGQQNVFFSAMGHVIGSQPDYAARDALVARLMDLPNQSWQAVIREATTNMAVLQQVEIMKRLTNILKANVAACSTLGPAFATQLGKIYGEMLHVYKIYSEGISKQVATGAAHVTQTLIVKSMRAVKQEILRLIETYIEHITQTEVQYVAQNFVSPLLESILPDYANSLPQARDAQVLSLMTTVINKLGALMTTEIPRIFGNVFSTTLDMITKNFIDYPEHRLHFFELIRAVNSNCFGTFFTLTPEQFTLVMNSIVWALKHTERNIANTGLTILQDLLTNIAQHREIADAFYSSYYLSILEEILCVVTDTFHKAHFKQHAALLRHLFQIVETGQLTANLAAASGAGVPTTTATAANGMLLSPNQMFLRQHIMKLLTTAFPNVAPAQLTAYIQALLDPNTDLAIFKGRLRDFLVSIKQFGATGSDNIDLFAEEQEAQEKKAAEAEAQRRAAVPGLLKPSELPDDGSMGDNN